MQKVEGAGVLSGRGSQTPWQLRNEPAVHTLRRMQALVLSGTGVRAERKTEQHAAAHLFALDCGQQGDGARKNAFRRLQAMQPEGSLPELPPKLRLRKAIAPILPRIPISMQDAMRVKLHTDRQTSSCQPYT